MAVRGYGLEPQLEFEPSMVTFGPILPHGAGVEKDIIVRNPCSFPIEFYSLNFDDQYLVEEKVTFLPFVEVLSYNFCFNYL